MKYVKNIRISDGPDLVEKKYELDQIERVRYLAEHDEPMMGKEFVYHTWNDIININSMIKISIDSKEIV